MEKIEKIGVFILNYNGLIWLKKTLKNIITYSKDVQVIVIDNQSTDESTTYFRTHFPQIDIIINKENFGFSKGYNKVLLEESRFKYFILIQDFFKQFFL